MKFFASQPFNATQQTNNNMATKKKTKKQQQQKTLHFKKITHTKKVDLIWTNDNGDELKFSTKDQPLPEFEEAIQGMASDIPELIPLDMEQVESLSVTQIMLRDHKKFNRTIEIKATVTPESGAEFNIKTPAYPLAEQEHHDADEQRLVQRLQDKVFSLEQEATRFQQGERAQAELELAGEQEAA